MTRHKHAHTGLVTPSPLDRWIDATLCVFAMLVHYVASTLQMIRRHDRVNATRAMPVVLPRAKTDTQQQEPQSVAASDTPIMHPTPACHPGSAKRYPGPIHPAGPTSQWFPALRYAAAGMTIIAPFEAAQPARSNNPAPPSLRVRRFASNPRRKSGPRAPRVMRIESGLHQQPWIPACAGMSGFFCPPNKNAAA